MNTKSSGSVFNAKLLDAVSQLGQPGLCKVCEVLKTIHAERVRVVHVKATTVRLPVSPVRSLQGTGGRIASSPVPQSS